MKIHNFTDNLRMLKLIHCQFSCFKYYVLFWKSHGIKGVDLEKAMIDFVLEKNDELLRQIKFLEEKYKDKLS